MIGHLKMKEKCRLNFFELVEFFLTKDSTKKNKKMESKLHSDSRQIEKKFKLSKPDREIDFKFKGNEIKD